MVEENTRILVRNTFNSKKFEAKIVCYNDECDLALLSVNDPNFWKGMESIEISEELPKLQSKGNFFLKIVFYFFFI